MKIKVGDKIGYWRFELGKFSNISEYEEQEVKQVAVRCGLNSEGYPISDEDYVIVGPEYKEVDYDEILTVNGEKYECRFEL